MPSRIAVTHDEWKSLGQQRGDNSSSTKRANNQTQASNSNDSKKKRSKKDHNKPKHPVTSYLFYSMEMRPKIGQDVSGSNRGRDIASKLGEGWRSLSVESRQRYETMASKDRERYYQEMTVYKNAQKNNGEAARTVTPPPPCTTTSANVDAAFI